MVRQYRLGDNIAALTGIVRKKLKGKDVTLNMYNRYENDTLHIASVDYGYNDGIPAIRLMVKPSRESNDWGYLWIYSGESIIIDDDLVEVEDSYCMYIKDRVA